MKLGKYSIGIGDRFAQQGSAQLAALKLAEERGLKITPVWNKSNREHQIVHSYPYETREASDAAVKEMKWKEPYFVDADHINRSNVNGFLEYSDFFTIDVADYIGKSASKEEISDFLARNTQHIGSLTVKGIGQAFKINQEFLENFANEFLVAIKEAALLYKYIESKKGRGNFITEISMDEVSVAQSPAQLYFILKELAFEGVPVDTIAPKFSGRFNKGVDYVGDIVLFEKEFGEFLCVINAAKENFEFPYELKLSIHSGSDKFSIYPVMGRLVHKHNQGIHLKTAGTTWLEEVIGLAMAGGEAFEMVTNIYSRALSRFDELCAPYSTVIDIDRARLPAGNEVQNWNPEKFVNTLRHNQAHPDYNLHFRQLMHVSYKIAAEYANVYIHHLNANKEMVGQQVTENLYSRHILRLFDL